MLQKLNEITTQTVPASARKRLYVSTEYRRDKQPRLDAQLQPDQQLASTGQPFASANQLSESISQPLAFTPSSTSRQSPPYTIDIYKSTIAIYTIYTIYTDIGIYKSTIT